MTTSRDWCFTSFVKDSVDAFKALENMPEAEKQAKIKFCIVQYENCPTSGKVHCQGFIVLKSPSKLTAVQKLIGDKTAHCEKRAGTVQQVISCCGRAERISTTKPTICPQCVHFLFPHL